MQLNRIAVDLLDGAQLMSLGESGSMKTFETVASVKVALLS